MLNHNTQTTSVKGISSRIQLNTNFHLWGNYEIFQIPFAEYEVLPVVAVWQTKQANLCFTLKSSQDKKSKTKSLSPLADKTRTVATKSHNKSFVSFVASTLKISKPLNSVSA